MRDLLTEASPFQYVEALDKVIYYPHLNNLAAEYFDPGLKHALDSIRIAKYTTFVPPVKFDATLSPIMTAYKPLRTPSDRLDVLFETELWKFSKPFV